MLIMTGRKTPIWKRARCDACSRWYTCGMKKVLTVSEFARLGGKARAAKLTKEQLSAIGKKGGRPRKRLGESPPRAGSALNLQAGFNGISLQARSKGHDLHGMKKRKREIKTIPEMDVTEKENFYRLLHRAISSPSTSRKSRPKKPSKSGGKKTRQRIAGGVQGKPSGTSR
jgi:hypothetical protein